MPELEAPSSPDETVEVPPPPPVPAAPLYFIAVGTDRRGPFTLEQLVEQPIAGSTMIWQKGMSQWNRASDVPLIATLLEDLPPPLPSTPGIAGPGIAPESATVPMLDTGTHRQYDDVDWIRRNWVVTGLVALQLFWDMFLPVPIVGFLIGIAPLIIIATGPVYKKGMNGVAECWVPSTRWLVAGFEGLLLVISLIVLVATVGRK